MNGESGELPGKRRPPGTARQAGKTKTDIYHNSNDKKMKKLLLGDEAIALGAIHAGLSGVYAYPGTPSTEITEFIQTDPIAKAMGVHSRWFTN